MTAVLGTDERAAEFAGPRVDRRGPASRAFTRNEIARAIHQWNETHGAPPTSSDWNPAKKRLLAAALVKKARGHLQAARDFEDGPWPSVTTVRERFSSMNAALVYAGFEPRSPGRQPKTEPEVLRLEANQIARADAATESRFRHLVRILLEAKAAGDGLALRAIWYELAEVAVALGDKVHVEEDMEAAA